MWTEQWGEKYVKQARTWLGTPFRHGQRLKGKKGGVDCFGLCVAAAAECGVDVIDELNYAQADNIRRLIPWFNRHCVQIAPSEVKPGDIVIFRYAGMPHHCCVWTGGRADTSGHGADDTATVLYASPASRGLVVETAVLPQWAANVFACFRWSI